MFQINKQTFEIAVKSAEADLEKAQQQLGEVGPENAAFISTKDVWIQTGFRENTGRMEKLRN